MRFLFFLLANALLFIRPSEFVADLYAVELYRYAIMVCLAISLPVVLEQLTRRYPGVPPVAACVLGLLPVMVLSNLLGGNGDKLLDNALDFFKVLVYYLLLLALVVTPQHLRRFLYWLSVFTAGLALIAVVRYHADVAAPPRPAVEESEDAAPATKPKRNGTFVVDKTRDAQTGAEVLVQRMCGTGIFNDPNDLALALVWGMPLCVFWLTDPARRHSRPFWVAALLLCGYALMLTHSRGGFLALLAGLAILLHVRFGGRQTILAGLLVFPLLLVAFAGRMTSISASAGTGQSRIQLWSDYLHAFQVTPLFGIGMGNYRQVSGHVAHNSFIHSYAELGIGGGTLFLGAFYFALQGLYLLRERKNAGPEAVDLPGSDELDPELRRLHPYVLAMVASYAVGILFLSLSYAVPTYMILGLATVYLRLRAGHGFVSVDWNRLVLPRLAGVSGVFLVVSYTFVRLFVHWR